MRRFADLYSALDASSGTQARVDALVAYFSGVDAADGAWALHVLLGKQGKRLITGRRLREICLADSTLPDWLFDDCYAQVGDSAETIALLWQQVAPQTDQPGADGSPPESWAGAPLHRWLDELLPAAAALQEEAQAEAVRQLWQGLSANELLVANKLLTGGLRVGVGPGLVLRALAQFSGLEAALLQHRLMGGFSRPYPFVLASPLEELPAGAAEDWLAEWKFDGIRGQLIHRAGQVFLWSRGEELINTAFPELIGAATDLPEGTVLDGEILVWPSTAAQPAPFSQLQRRLGRKAPGRALLAACPAAFVAYDLLEGEGDDMRQRPLRQRRAALEELLHRCSEASPTPAAGLLRLSPRLPLTGPAGAAAPAGRGGGGRRADAQGPRLPLPGGPAAGLLVETQARPRQPRCGAALRPGRQRPAGQPVHRLHLWALEWRRPVGDLRQGLLRPERCRDHGPGSLDPPAHHRAVWSGAGRGAPAGV